MGKSRHTPGPWSFSKCQCGHSACKQFIMSNQGTVGFYEDDARFMSASPELKAELERLREIVVDAVARGQIEACPEVDAALYCSAKAIEESGGYSDA